MFLKYIELTGFKSFADRVKLEFHPGVTAIVGPNGCGKSNVLDAVRWVLGEQSARALRGREMADLIFNGTDKRKPLGMAEVLLTFSDCQGELGVEYNEITVGRRVFRDGSSEYELNGKICRLKDIQSLFMDTGIGRSAYSIMEQGKINQLLSAKPEDRREVFEEAAGITKYKSQKREALRKLEATDANLLRVSDIIQEVKRQIGSLQRQAAKARKYQEVFAELKTLEWALAHTNWKEQTAASDAARKSLTEKRAQISQVQNELQSLEQKTVQLRSELDKTESELEQARNRQLSGKTDLQRLSSQIEFNKERLQSLDVADELAKTEITQLEEKIRIQQEAASQIEQTLSSLRDQARQQLAKLSEQQNMHQAAERLLTQIRDQLAQERREQERRDTEWARLATELASRDAERRTAQLRIESLQHDLHDLQTAKSFALQGLEEKKSALVQAEADIQSAKEKLTGLKQQLQQAEVQISQLNDNRNSIEHRIVETSSRLHILESLEKSYEGLSTGTQKLLNALTSGRLRIPFSGLLSEKIQIQPEATLAIERLLQGKFEALLLTNPEAFWELASWWKTHGEGQRIWVALQGGIAPPSAVAALPAESALRFVSFPEDLRPLLCKLLGESLVASDLAHARVLRQQYPGYPIATRQGDYLSREGILELAGEVRLGKILERRQEILRLSGAVEELRAEAQKAAQTCQLATAERDRICAEIETASEALRKAERTRDDITAEIRRSEQELSTMERRNQELSRQIEALHNAEQQSENRFQQQISRRSELEQLRAQNEGAISALLARLSEQESKSVALTATLTELRIQAAEIEEKRKSFELQANTHRERLTELERTLQSRTTQLQDNATRRTVIQDETEELRHQQTQLTQELEQLAATLENLSARRSELSEKIRSNSDQERQLRAKLTTLQDERSALELTLEKHTLALEAAHERLAQRFQLTPDDIAAGPPEQPALEGGLQAWSARAAELNQVVDRMGPVNMEAISEYEELESREKFLEEQYNDLLRSKDQLTKAIEQLNISTHQMFSETFEKIKNNFQEMFAELFGGGKATIQLQDENDPLECGIDIIAKPPGKEPKSIVSLSGGEQTMTAVALMFAIYMVKPSPFCILDEMDAPLDESNINRFLNILKRFTSQSQFLLITHNKRTIAFADAIYGVTQEENGVSKVVSVRFTPLTSPRPAATQGSGPSNDTASTTQKGDAVNSSFLSDLVQASEQSPVFQANRELAQAAGPTKQNASEISTLNNLQQDVPLKPSVVSFSPVPPDSKEVTQPLPASEIQRKKTITPAKAKPLAPQQHQESNPDVTQVLPGSEILRRNAAEPSTAQSSQTQIGKQQAIEATQPLPKSEVLRKQQQGQRSGATPSQEGLSTTIPIARLAPTDPNASLSPPKPTASPRPVTSSATPPQKDSPAAPPKPHEVAAPPPAKSTQERKPLAGLFRRFGKKNTPNNGQPPGS